MDSSDIITSRLLNQHISKQHFNVAKDVVAHMGAIQAQDYAMAKWAIGIRCGIKEKKVNEAINNYEIIRTHVLRPTWHFVAATDIRWMLSLSAPYIKAASSSMCKKLELDEKLLKRCNGIIKGCLKENNHLTRDELMQALNKNKITANDICSALIMMNAELDGIVCSGEMRGKKFTYTLFDNVIPDSKVITKDEALVKLLKIYFTSHAPATLQDFCWCSSIPITTAKKALELIKPNIQFTHKKKKPIYLFTLFQIKKLI